MDSSTRSPGRDIGPWPPPPLLAASSFVRTPNAATGLLLARNCLTFLHISVSTQPTVLSSFCGHSYIPSPLISLGVCPNSVLAFFAVDQRR